VAYSGVIGTTGSFKSPAFRFSFSRKDSPLMLIVTLWCNTRSWGNSFEWDVTFWVTLGWLAMNSLKPVSIALWGYAASPARTAAIASRRMSNTTVGAVTIGV